MISDLAFLLVGFVVVFCLFACFFFFFFFSDGAANTAVKGLIVKGK